MLITGQKAKAFTLRDKDGNPVSLSDFEGRKVVIYFYPKDDTPGCTKQACAFRDAYAGFAQINVPVLGISHDSVESHQKFAQKYNLPFILLADPQGTAIADYDVKGVFGATRTTYIISEEGLVEKVFEKASPDTNAADILNYLKNEEHTL